MEKELEEIKEQVLTAPLTKEDMKLINQLKLTIWAWQ